MRKKGPYAQVANSSTNWMHPETGSSLTEIFRRFPRVPIYCPQRRSRRRKYQCGTEKHRAGRVFADAQVAKNYAQKRNEWMLICSARKSHEILEFLAKTRGKWSGGCRDCGSKAIVSPAVRRFCPVEGQPQTAREFPTNARESMGSGDVSLPDAAAAVSLAGAIRRATSQPLPDGRGSMGCAREASADKCHPKLRRRLGRAGSVGRVNSTAHLQVAGPTPAGVA
jgi:hypothetical protein